MEHFLEEGGLELDREWISGQTVVLTYSWGITEESLSLSGLGLGCPVESGEVLGGK